MRSHRRRAGHIGPSKAQCAHHCVERNINLASISCSEFPEEIDAAPETRRKEARGETRANAEGTYIGHVVAAGNKEAAADMFTAMTWDYY